MFPILEADSDLHDEGFRVMIISKSIWIWKVTNGRSEVVDMHMSFSNVMEKDVKHHICCDDIRSDGKTKLNGCAFRFLEKKIDCI